MDGEEAEAAATEATPEEEEGEQPAADEAASESPAVEPEESTAATRDGPPGESEEEGAEGGPSEAEGAPSEAEGAPSEAEGGPSEAEGATVTFDELEEVPSKASLFGGLLSSSGYEEAEESLGLSTPQVRDISQSLWELDQQVSLERLEPGISPAEEEEEDNEEKEAARRAEEQQQRAELVEQYRQLVAEGVHLRHYGARLQSKLAEALNKAKAKEHAPAKLEQHVSDKDQRYTRYLGMLQELRSQQREEMAWYQQQADSLRQTCDQQLAKVNSQWKAYQTSKKEVAVYTMGRCLGGKQAAIYKVDQIQRREESKEREMMEVRLENIKLKHRIIKLDTSLKAQEELAEGLHLIDFEQLKIENQTYNEKIEERNEELLKLRGKITNTVHILTQVKEKLQFVEAENQDQKGQLMAVEALLARKRDGLTKTKQARDRLRIDNEKLYQKSGLLGDTVLLRDFEEKVNVAEVLEQNLDILKRQHAGLALTCEGVKKKIRGIKSFLPF